uniref:Uncharacterized protein n=1 Tax=Steinernema glaseri TaxID=37863 RepID=A0A1I8A5Q2_9BILA
MQGGHLRRRRDEVEGRRPPSATLLAYVQTRDRRRRRTVEAPASTGVSAPTHGAGTATTTAERPPPPL